MPLGSSRTRSVPRPASACAAGHRDRSDYAQAWALMALGQMLMHFAHGRRGDDGMAAAERALALDGNLAEAHAVKARILSSTGVTTRHRPRSIWPCASIPSPTRSTSRSVLAASAAPPGRGHSLLRKGDGPDGDGRQLADLADDLLWRVGDPENARRAALIALARAERILTQDQNNGAAMAMQSVRSPSSGGRTRPGVDQSRAADRSDNMNMRYNFACSLTVLKQTEAALELLGPYLRPRTSID